MWHCDQCGAEAEDHFEVCWRCGAPRTGYEPPEGEDEAPASVPLPPEDPPEPEARTCAACGAGMDEQGVVPLRVGGAAGLSVFGDLAEAGDRTWRVEVWVCGGCRRLELFEAADEDY